MASVTELLFIISNALLVPVIAAVLLFLAWSAVLAGGFARECLARRMTRQVIDRTLAAAKEGAKSARIWEVMRSASSGVLRAFSTRVDPEHDQGALRKHAITQIEHDMAASLARLSLLTRVGPMLGLMGTLIPLGPALTELAAGNTQGMAQNLVVAFATTVLGVLIGSLAYGIGLVRRGWYARDLEDLEFVCERLTVQEGVR